ncbi:exocyst complex component Sec10-domain-containing protein [Mycena maculata]|uniref:Exocyst complex component Sec10-domain-containing protein n=1 Tax=Mycena maculata TaxID=230809 RepID=A0AAD7MS81_9AGAR|nr:exocyst complex component Sec10-domain-containing protein [Mycena maculata]
MEKFATLEPVRLYNSAATTGARLFPRTQQPKAPATSPLIGRLPSDLHLLILSYLPVPDFPAYARCTHATAGLSRSETIWEARWKALGVEAHKLGSVLDDLEARSRGQAAASRAAAPPMIPVDDEFGDFASVDVFSAAPSLEEMGDFVGDFGPPTPRTPMPFIPAKPTFRTMFMRAHSLLRPLTAALASPPHVILTEISSILSSPSLRQESLTLHLLSLFLSPRVKPLRKWDTLYASLRSAMDRFDANALAGFDAADSRDNEKDMREAAESSWEVWDGEGDWEMGKVWAEKREIFYQQGQWRPLDNFTADGGLNFDAMDEFMSAILGAIIEHGSRAVRVFPPASEVLISFADRVATDVVAEYITSLLTRARELSNATYLKATAATFRESWRMVDAIMQAAAERPDSNVQRTRAEDVVYQMFEINMDEYLDEEVESVKQAFEVTCKGWDQQMADQATSGSSSTRFLSSHNPAQVKRNVLASFTSVLLLPVTIVPRAVGGALMTGGNAAVQGIAMLNPQRWGGGNTGAVGNGYSRNLELEKGPGATLFDEEDDEDEKFSEKATPSLSSASSSVSHLDLPSAPLSSRSTTSLASGIATPLTGTGVNKLELLLSLDVALELIHADHEALKRVETFAGYPGHYGHRVRDTIEELFILMLQALGGRHISVGFGLATEQMAKYKPEEHQETTSVAPLLQFFELVHIGDTIQSMVQVFFDKELAPHIDRTDFLNAVVREKKRFENSLDDCVAAGLNAGTEVLMNQVDHIILTLTQVREYYPPEDAPMELGPTKGCTEAIKCLEMHCKLLKGSTSKEVLEVFYQEVGIRLIAILQKHIKRQIISLNGGFQVIADLNRYHVFISSLKVPSITADFSHLKMLGHVYVVDDAKDLAQIVRDVSRYGGAYRPEDIYEFIQRRSDWKKIEKTVDKTMYNLSFKEDCVIC